MRHDTLDPGNGADAIHRRVHPASREDNDAVTGTVSTTGRGCSTDRLGSDQFFERLDQFRESYDRFREGIHERIGHARDRRTRARGWPA